MPPNKGGTIAAMVTSDASTGLHLLAPAAGGLNLAPEAFPTNKSGQDTLLASESKLAETYQHEHGPSSSIGKGHHQHGEEFLDEADTAAMFEPPLSVIVIQTQDHQSYPSKSIPERSAGETMMISMQQQQHTRQQGSSSSIIVPPPPKSTTNFAVAGGGGASTSSYSSAPGTTMIHAASSSYRGHSLSLGGGAGGYASSPSASSSSSPFRLQPRNPPKIFRSSSSNNGPTLLNFASPPRSSPSPSRGGSGAAAGGGLSISNNHRKRRVHSISCVTQLEIVTAASSSVASSTSTTPARPRSLSSPYGGSGLNKIRSSHGSSSSTGSVATETTARETLPGTPTLPPSATNAEDPTHVPPPSSPGTPVLNLQGLSLMSPCRHTNVKIGSTSNSGSSIAAAAASPASQAQRSRSGFSPYSPPFASGVTSSNNHTTMMMLSPCDDDNNSKASARSSSKVGSSPRIAPLIVLGGPTKAVSFNSASSVTAKLETAAALLDSPPTAIDDKTTNKLPPLHNFHLTTAAVFAVAAPDETASAVPSNMMHSLDESAVLHPSTKAAKRNGGEVGATAKSSASTPMTPPYRFLPPPTVLCHPSTPGSTLSHEAMMMPSAAVRLLAETEIASPPSSGGGGPATRTPIRGGPSSRNRQGHHEESPSRRSVTSMSPTSTPLPRLTLTPRSTTSNPVARQLFLSLPTTPSDWNDAATATISRRIARGGTETTVDAAAVHLPAPPPPPTSAALPSPRRKNSYIPLPDWASEEGPLHGGRVEASFLSGSHSLCHKETRSASHHPTPHHHHRTPTGSHPSPALLSTSLLSPPSPNDAIERFLKDSSCGGGMPSYPGTSERASAGFRTARADDDNDSLSASDDDDEAFFLATPLAIQEEKQSSLQQSKLRKLRDNSQSHPFTTSHHSFASSSVFQASSTSLRGMNFVTSSTSLDKIGRNMTSSCGNNVSGSLKRQESSASIGLNLEGANGGGPSGGEESDDTMDIQIDPDGRLPPLGPPLLRATSSQTYLGPTLSACNPRDLVTPPVMAQPRSPPPLPPPRIPTETEISSSSGSRALPPGRDAQCGSPSSPHAPLSSTQHPSRSSSPPPPPRGSSSAHWPCSGEADSPMDLCVTSRIFFTSTDPDGSPSG